MVLHRQSSNLVSALQGRCIAYDIQANQGAVQGALALFRQVTNSVEPHRNKAVG